ncbi:unnamed protein product [Vicia faba]|uniref:Uncharacterized protein n=1 Tax=Vicia faba TaxID=3906 RepID=A0AAV0ZN24_VICFA|nr:unnamed protein product [Vicia faba]
MPSKQPQVLLLLGMVILITTSELGAGQQEEDPPTQDPQPVKDPPVPTDPVEKPPKIGQTPHPKPLHKKLLSLSYNSLFHKSCNKPPSSVFQTQDDEDKSSPVKELQMDKTTSPTIKKLYIIPTIL